MKAKVYAVIFFFLGLLAVVTPRYILPVCEFKGFMPMHCSETALYEAWAGSGIMLVSVMALFGPARPARVVLPLLILAAGIMVAYIPQITGFCRSPSMPCNYGSIPALRLLGAGTVIVALLSMRSFLRKVDEDN